MTRLPEERPKIYKYFTGGGFSVQISKENPFSRIPVDQTIEETTAKIPQTANCDGFFVVKITFVVTEIKFLGADIRLLVAKITAEITLKVITSSVAKVTL